MATPIDPGFGPNSPAETSAGKLIPKEVSGAVDVASAEAALKNNYAAQWAFWHQQDTKDAQGNVVEGELAKFLDTAIQSGWLQAQDPTNFETNLRKTQWYKDNGAQGLLAAKDEFSNPTTFKDSLARRVTDIQNVALAQGYKLDPETISNLARTSLYSAYDTTVFNSSAYQTQLQAKVAQAAKAANTPISLGAGLTNEQKLRVYGQDMGVNLGDSWYTSAANTINDPTSGADYATYEKMIRDQAAAKYSGFSDLINKGVTVKQIADPYVQSMASILEVDPATIDYTKDPTVQKGLGMTMAAGGVTQPMPMWQYEQSLRQDPRWAYTNNARDSVNSMAHTVLKDFGLVG
jgi:hypothetical protein